MNHHSMINVITHYGYAGIFLLLFIGIVGIPLPIEIILLGAGYIALKANLYIGGIIGFAWLGACAGMTLNYFLGQSIGLKRISMVTKWIKLSQSRLEKWAEHFKKHGAILLLVGYYVAGLRHAAPFIAGATRMRLAKFMSISYFGALAWILIIVLLGQKLGKAWHHIFTQFNHPIWIIIAAVIIGLGLLGAKMMVRQRRFSS
ncbi:membrane protein DedA, SNARE-associated domain [Paenibacillus sp. yr247]|uniref:DedA family protein n=1 Tax=Paenibacillus sp. yr247 TaxID=1761880 RepID=UPI00088F973D|nr:DedA family protein [Paenibacillus sp. yr247]SDN75389.1 membrane protein DedA, SNARE-associated domain [Paenibacillus sp. yr247]